MIKVGVIGIGNMGLTHATQIFAGKVEEMKLIAVCDINIKKMEEAKKKFADQVLYYSDYHELLQDKVIDAVIIATPHFAHPVIAIAAFQAGLHVLTEKPAGVDTGSVRKMIEASRESGKLFAIMYNQRTNPLFIQLRNMIKEGKLGKIKRFVWIVNNWYRTQAYYDSGSWRATWNGEGGGVLINQCPHNLDIWQWMIGMPERIHAFCNTGKYHNIQVEDDATIYAEYKSGANACFITSTGEYPGTNRIEISGTKGKVVLEDGHLKLYLLNQDEREICFHSKQAMPSEKINMEVIEPSGIETGHLGILNNFSEAIRLGTPLIAPGEDGMNGLMISNAAYLSEWTNEWVDLPVDEERFLKELKKKQDEEIISRNHIEEETSLKDNSSQVASEYQERWKVRW